MATRSGFKAQILSVLAKCGIQAAMTDLFGVAGTHLLEELVLPGVFNARIASQRRIIEALDFEIDLFATENDKSIWPHCAGLESSERRNSGLLGARL